MCFVVSYGPRGFESPLAYPTLTGKGFGPVFPLTSSRPKTDQLDAIATLAPVPRLEVVMTPPFSPARNHAEEIANVRAGFEPNAGKVLAIVPNARPHETPRAGGFEIPDLGAPCGRRLGLGSEPDNAPQFGVV